MGSPAYYHLYPLYCLKYACFNTKYCTGAYCPLTPDSELCQNCVLVNFTDGYNQVCPYDCILSNARNISTCPQKCVKPVEFCPEPCPPEDCEFKSCMRRADCNQCRRGQPCTVFCYLDTTLSLTSQSSSSSSMLWFIFAFLLLIVLLVVLYFMCSGGSSSEGGGPRSTRGYTASPSFSGYLAPGTSDDPSKFQSARTRSPKTQTARPKSSKPKSVKPRSVKTIGRSRSPMR